MMAADTMEALGIGRGQYVVKVNNRKVLDGVRDAIGVTDDASLADGHACNRQAWIGWAYLEFRICSVKVVKMSPGTSRKGRDLAAPI